MSTAKGSILEIVSRPELAKYHGHYPVRDAESAAELKAALASGKTHSSNVLSLDLTNLANVREIANTINSRVAAGEIPPIRALVLNAGWQDFGKQSWIETELDKMFAAKYLGHWLLALLLLRSMDKDAGRIVVVGSQSHDPYDKRNDPTRAYPKGMSKTIVEDGARMEAIAKGTWSSAKEDPSWPASHRRYGAAKLCLIMMMHELQQRLDQDPALNKVCILGTDLGTMAIGISRRAPWIIRALLFQIIFPSVTWLMPNGNIRPTSRSAADLLWAAFDSDEILGEFPKDLHFLGRGPFPTSAESQDAQNRDVMWKESVRLADLKEGDTVLTHWS
ncbi:putative short-chain dehydrogenase [Lophiotrema nucula]|uniref:Putative short-chain dehydrogenase n=1 Tax=Lophiotrema nucula TaxID=690887 RepID=A0A6A5ZFN0_9PLEO|nr:putative short-chain dehydrogenase [Lophiotrema nucula]